MQLCQTVVLPLIAGQLLQYYLGINFIEIHLKPKIPFSVISQIALVAIIFNVFCDMHAQQEFQIDGWSAIISTFWIIIWQVVVLVTINKLARIKYFHFNERDVIALLFTASHKSLTIGIPLIRIVYGHHSFLGYISLPLLIYHPAQIILGSALTPYLRNWLSPANSIV